MHTVYRIELKENGKNRAHKTPEIPMIQQNIAKKKKDEKKRRTHFSQ